MGYKAATRPVKQGLVVSCMVPVNQWRRQQSSSLSPYLRVVPTRPSYTQYQQRQCQFVRMGIKLVFIEGLGSSSIRRCTLSAPNPDCSEERLRYAIPHKETALWPLPPCNLTSVMASLPTKKEKILSVHRPQAKKKKKQPKSTSESTFSPFSPSPLSASPTPHPPQHRSLFRLFARRRRHSQPKLAPSG